MQLSRKIILAGAALSLFASCKKDLEKIGHIGTPIEEPQIEKGITLNDMFGVNAYEWNFLQDPNNPAAGSTIFEPKMSLIKTFSGVRHYMDWEKIEDTPGSYTFNPTRRGGWNYDAIYERSKQDGILVLACLKEPPHWLYNTYPEGQRDQNNVPAPYGSDREDPASYIAQAKAAFQFAARYGANKNVDPALVTVNSTPRWTGDPVNEVKIGLNLIKYIEGDNERDRWWVGDRAFQSGREYAAHLSAFYDGHKGTLGKNVGVKTADPSMVVVMGGLATPSVEYVREMIQWCKENRGYKPDGSINLCFDVINYHQYANDADKPGQWGYATRGLAPEVSSLGQKADEFVALSKEYGLDVWVTETGYDVGPYTPQRAIPIGEKSALITQADWLLRTSLLYARSGIKKTFFYQLFDDADESSHVQYSTSGLVTKSLQRRPSGDYVYQASKLMGNYTYKETISKDPLVDVYVSGGKKMYILTIPDEINRKGTYELSLPGSKNADVYHLQPGSDDMKVVKVPTQGGKVKIEVTETPVFVQGE